MTGKTYLFLLGVDYSEALKNLDVLKNSYAIIPISEPLFTSHSKIEEQGFKKVLKISYKSDELEDVVSRLKADVLISLGWRRILKPQIISKFSLAINVHPALLPSYKGYHTEPYVIQNNEKKHGITAHILTEGLDDGEIIYQKEFNINKFSTTKSIKAQVFDIMPCFLAELILSIESNSYNLIQQDKSKTKVVAGKRTPQDSEINPNKSLLELFDQIRSTDPEKYPAFFYVEGEKVYIKVWRENAIKDHPLDI